MVVRDWPWFKIIDNTSRSIVRFIVENRKLLDMPRKKELLLPATTYMEDSSLVVLRIKIFIVNFIFIKKIKNGSD